MPPKKWKPARTFRYCIPGTRLSNARAPRSFSPICCAKEGKARLERSQEQVAPISEMRSEKVNATHSLYHSANSPETKSKTKLTPVEETPTFSGRESNRHRAIGGDTSKQQTNKQEPTIFASSYQTSKNNSIQIQHFLQALRPPKTTAYNTFATLQRTTLTSLLRTRCTPQKQHS